MLAEILAYSKSALCHSASPASSFVLFYTKNYVQFADIVNTFENKTGIFFQYILSTSAFFFCQYSLWKAVSFGAAKFQVDSKEEEGEV